MARRDYSEKELREKLSDRFTDEAIQTAITKAHEQRWIKDPFELAERWSEHLHRKGKGHRSVAHALQERGLPPVERDPDRELEKAKALLDKKFPGKAKLSVNERQKAYRYLAYRGFDFETIAVLLKSERVNHEEF